MPDLSRIEVNFTYRTNFVLDLRKWQICLQQILQQADTSKNCRYKKKADTAKIAAADTSNHAIFSNYLNKTFLTAIICVQHLNRTSYNATVFLYLFWKYIVNCSQLNTNLPF